MNILVPIQNSIDIAHLAEAGATEVYCGFLLKEWISQYNTSEVVESYSTIPCCLNNRNSLKANLLEERELIDCLAACEVYNIRLYVVVNSKYYPECSYGQLKKYLDLLTNLSVEHLIASDLGLIEYLNNEYPNFKVSVSCLNQVTNDGSISFYKEFPNVERIVFPRHMKLKHMTKMLKNHKDLEFEFFGLSNKCLYDDGFCRGIHDFYPVCKDNWEMNFYEKEQVMSLEERKKLHNRSEDFLRWAKGYDDDGSVDYPWKGVACSMCSLFNLVSYDNITLKLAGRGYKIEERVAQVTLVKKTLEAIEQGKNLEEIKDLVKTFMGLPFFCDGNNCIMKGEVWK